MLKKLLLFMIATAAPLSAWADCNFPRAPEQMPDGKTASEAQMAEAMAAFKQYNGDVNSYTSCLEKETSDKIRETGGATGAIVQIKSLQSKKHNAAVVELQNKAKIFNEQVRLYKSRGK